MVEIALNVTYASKGAARGCRNGRTRSIASFSNQRMSAIFQARSAPLMECGSVTANNRNSPKMAGSRNCVQGEVLASTGSLGALPDAADWIASGTDVRSAEAIGEVLLCLSYLQDSQHRCRGVSGREARLPVQPPISRPPLDFPATKSVLTVTPLEYGKWPSLLPESFPASLRGLRDAIRGRKRMKQKYRDLMAKRKIDDAH